MYSPSSVVRNLLYCSPVMSSPQVSIRIFQHQHFYKPVCPQGSSIRLNAFLLYPGP